MTSDEVTVYQNFLFSDTVISFDKPQTGVVRLAIMGDWTNAGAISADLEITETRKDDDDEETSEGKVEQSQTDVVYIDIPAGTAQAIFDLAWDNNWGAYPTDDLDLILLDPNGGVFFDGATLASPERVIVDNPVSGTWVLFIDGFTVHGVIDDEPYSEWELTARADGEVIELEDDDSDDDDSGDDDD